MNTTGQYRVWSDDLSETEEMCSLVMAYDHEAAAVEYAELSHNDEPFSSSIRVHVRSTFGGDHGELKVFTVHPEPAIEFYAYEDPASGTPTRSVETEGLGPQDGGPVPQADDQNIAQNQDVNP